MGRLLLVLLAAFAPAASGSAAPLLSQTTYLCDVGADCPIPTTNAGPVPVDPNAFDGSNTTIPLDPGASVTGSHSGAGLTASATATSLGLAPPALRLSVADTDLSADQAVVAHIYWEDTLTVTRTGAMVGAPTSWMPMLDYSGIMDLFAGSGAAGGVEWTFNIAVNTNTFLGAGGFCQPGFGTGAIDCSANTGFGPSTPASVFVASGVPFTVQAGAVLRIGGPNITGQIDMMPGIDWLGVVVGDNLGTPTSNFTMTSASGIDWTQASIPEPSSALLLALGLGGVALSRRRGR